MPFEIPETIQESPNEHTDCVKKMVDLYVQFAEAVAKKNNVPIETALLEKTPLYRRFGLGRKLNSNNPVWKEYIEGLKLHSIREWTADFYTKRKNTPKEDSTVEQEENMEFGCFSFNTLHEGKAVHIHFDNKDTSGNGPLSAETMQTRLKELEAMFRYIQSHHSEVKTVYGGSWLYNLESYRRLFPTSYTSSVKPNREEKFNNTSRWEQFMNSEGEIKQDLVKELFDNLEEVVPEELSRAFPYPALYVQAPIEDFYQKYGITTPPQMSEESSAS